MPTNPEIKEYQIEIANTFSEFYRDDHPVAIEWSSIFEKGIYSPRVDIAVGPFAVVEGERYINEYNYLMDVSSTLIYQLIEFHLNNTKENITPDNLFKQLSFFNPNSRCFMAIEIESTGSRKHLMGDAVNASALGRIGIVIGWTQEMFVSFLNLKRYFDYLGRVGKNTFNLANLLILDSNQLRDSIQRVL